ncbi:MAG: amino acid adenylation domain-containing protein, partial [Acidobacteriota bacterium]|nr:amino acid adenylation domain-containing protein [Acidobacteriota bacterium]
REAEAIAAFPPEDLPPLATPDDTIYVIFTSGSTGRPKGVDVPNRGVVNLLTWMAQELAMGPADVVPVLASFGFDMSIPELYLALTTGGAVLLTPRMAAADGEALAALLQRHQATMLHATPTTWGLLLDAGFTGAGLKRCIGAEALPRELFLRLMQAAEGTPLYNLYGPTETTVWSTFHRFTSAEERITIGRPIANTQVYILDEQLQPVPVGVPGGIYISGDGVTRGYLGRPDLTAEKFLPHPFLEDGRLYVTGDVGRYLPDGRIEYLQRADHQVKIRGFRIELGEIEAVLAAHPALRESVVVAREDQPGMRSLAAYYVAADPAQTVEPGELRDFLKSRLPDYMIPSGWMQLERLPVSPNGKVDRKALPAPETLVSRSANGNAPSSTVEVRLATIWEEVLNVTSVSLDDDFFSLGGHSLLAVQMMTRAREAFGFDLPLTLLFSAPRLGELARVIQNERGKHPFKTIIPIRKGGNRPPLFCVARPNVNALGFVFLMRHLAPEQPVIGLQAQMEKDGSSWVYDQADYEAKAAEYIQAMREAYPDGPYFLTGYCEGAHIAFEMARMLEAQGLPVAMLAILDAWPVENTVSRTKYKLRGYLREFRKFRKLSLTGKLHFLTRNRFRKQQTQAALDPVAAAAAAKAAEQLRLANEQLRRRYWPGPDFVPTRWGGRLTLFRTDKQLHIRIRDYKMGWGQRALGGVDVIRVEGDHFLMLREPYVVDLAHNMQRVMDEAYARWQAEQGSAASTKRSADGL